MPEARDPNSEEKVLGLDPRALLARLTSARPIGGALPSWVPPSEEEMRPLFPQFETPELIGRGGMGAVYRARQPALDRFVAIKLLPVETAVEESFATRFQTEARALARLQHPNIVAVYDFGQTSAGHLYFVMEYVDGSDLAALLRSGGVTPPRAVEIMRGVCGALEFAHTRGIVHRDIKPGNVLIGRDGAVKVADFGLARLRAEADRETSALTASGTVLGTPDYMAPEQREGGDIDSRADLYSAGVMLYELLTGKLPRGAWEPPSRVAKTDARFDRIVTRAIHPDPVKRFQHARELGEQLARVPAKPQRWPRWASIALVAVAIAASVLAWQWRRDFAAKRAPTTPENTTTQELELLRGLDLAASRVAGDWDWLDDRAGGTVTTDFNLDREIKRLRLPVRPGRRAYEFSFELWIAKEGGNAGVVLSAGAARVALWLDHFNDSGLEFVRQLQWKANETTVHGVLPQERFFPVEISVRPDGDSVSIAVRIEGAPFIDWHGLQSDLTLPGQLVPTEDRTGAEALAFVSNGGGLRIREVKVRLLP